MTSPIRIWTPALAIAIAALAAPSITNAATPTTNNGAIAETTAPAEATTTTTIAAVVPTTATTAPPSTTTSSTTTTTSTTTAPTATTTTAAAPATTRAPAPTTTAAPTTTTTTTTTTVAPTTTTTTTTVPPTTTTTAAPPPAPVTLNYEGACPNSGSRCEIHPRAVNCDAGRVVVWIASTTPTGLRDDIAITINGVVRQQIQNYEGGQVIFYLDVPNDTAIQGRIECVSAQWN